MTPKQGKALQQAIKERDLGNINWARINLRIAGFSRNEAADLCILSLKMGIASVKAVVEVQ